MSKKLKNKSGETLVETLVSLLIALLSVLMLSTAVLASNKINQQNREMDERFQSELQEVEGLEETVEKKEVTLSIQFESIDGGAVYESTTTEVLLYGGEESQFLSYDYMPQEDKP